MIYFSKLANGFYSNEIHGENIPSDAVEITPEHHAYLLAQQSEGKFISSDETGRPIVTEQPEKTTEQIASEIRSTRDSRLNETSWLVERHKEQLDLGQTTLNQDQYMALIEYRQALRDIPNQSGFPLQVDWPTLRADIMPRNITFIDS